MRCAYVITLDSDTVLPPDAAPAAGRRAGPPAQPRGVRSTSWAGWYAGYGILQPRVGVSLPSAHRSLFASIHSGHPGVDPYTTAVSDVYQDLYGEGSFTGKGVYDVEAFERATHGRFPENTLLSHDLIEGNYARAGLATDVIVYDDYPTRYLTYHPPQAPLDPGRLAAAALAPARVPGPEGRERNRLSILSRWKIIDNLRRSTVELAQLVFLVAGWTLLPGSPIRWTLLGHRRHRRALDRLAPARAGASAAGQVLAGLLCGGGARFRHQHSADRAGGRRSCPTRPGSRPTRSSAPSGG